MYLKPLALSLLVLLVLYVASTDEVQIDVCGAAQSTTRQGAIAEKAIDGNLTTSTHTLCVADSWFIAYVSVKGGVSVSKVTIINGKLNRNRSRLNKSQVYVVSEAGEMLLCGEIKTTGGNTIEAQTYTIDCGGKVGTAVKVLQTTSKCLEIREIYVYTTGGSSDCECEADSYREDWKCTECPEGKVSLRGSDAADDCTWSSCSAGEYMTVNGCEECPANTYSLDAATVCTECEEGETSQPGSDSSDDCSSCSAGEYMTDNGCEECPANTYSLDAATECTECEEGETSLPGSDSSDDCSIWSAVIHNTVVDLQEDMERNPLLIKTTTTDARNVVALTFGPIPYYSPVLNWKFDNTATVNACGGYWSKRFYDVPATTVKVWAVRKTPTYISIHCNGVEVFKLIYSSVSQLCEDTWSPVSTTVKFTRSDTASQMYAFGPVDY